MWKIVLIIVLIILVIYNYIRYMGVLIVAKGYMDLCNNTIVKLSKMSPPNAHSTLVLMAKTGIVEIK